MNESPTPYDILPPAPFPFALPSYAPMLLILLLATCAALWFLSRRKKKIHFQSTEEQIRAMLNALTMKENVGAENLNRLRLLLQRYLSTVTTRLDDTLSYSESDLHALLKTSSDERTKEVCNALVLIERMRYSSTIDPQRISATVTKLREYI